MNLIPLKDVMILLCSHFIGDFVLQSQLMADKKSKNIWWLLSHGIIYSIVLFTLMLIFTTYSTKMLILFTFINGINHIIFDRLSSRYKIYYYRKKKIHQMFTLIGFDQLFHTSILILTDYLILI